MTKWIVTITFAVEIEADTKENAEYQAEWYRCVEADDLSQTAKSESPISVSAEQSARTSAEPCEICGGIGGEHDAGKHHFVRTNG